MKLAVLSALFVMPAMVHAQSLQAYIPNVVDFITGTLIPFLLGIGFLIVAINIVRFFVIESTNEQGREKARAYIIYSVLAYVIVIVFFGVIGLLVSALNLTGGGSVSPDIPGFPAGNSALCDSGDPIADCICNGGSVDICLAG